MKDQEDVKVLFQTLENSWINSISADRPWSFNNSAVPKAREVGDCLHLWMVMISEKQIKGRENAKSLITTGEEDLLWIFQKVSEV